MQFPKLNEVERRSSLWLKLKAMLEAELDDLRKQNDGEFRFLSEVDTARIRGSISLVKALLDIECPEENNCDL